MATGGGDRDGEKTPPPQHYSLEVDERGVGVLTLSFGPKATNLFCPNFLRVLQKAVEEVERDGSIRSLVITGGGKYFSAGLNTKWMSKNPFGSILMVKSSYRLLARILALGIPTVAAINGHAVGAGFFLALVCDHRVMAKTKKGYLLLPELDLGMPLSPGFNAIAKCKLTKPALRDTALLCRRWTPEDALGSSVVDGVSSPATLLSDAKQRAFEASGGGRKERKRHVYSMIKKEIYSECYETLTSWGSLPRMLETLGGLALAANWTPKSKL